jgi:hypothetical protein
MTPLEQSLARSPMRVFPRALAHYIVATKPGDGRRDGIIIRHFNAMSAADQAECRGEIVAAKRAKRGELLADVA